MNVVVPRREVPVLEDADVLVCGGGCAGIAAAVSASRTGARTVLLERWPTVGGMATNALVNGWHRSDREKMVIYGLVEESAQRARTGGWIRQDSHYPHAHETHWFDPEGMRIVWHRMLDEADVVTLCGLTAGDPVVEDGRVTAVLVDTKTGRKAVRARVVVDATGDGDVAAASGVPFAIGRESDGKVQGMTLMFQLRGIDPSMRDERRDAVDRVREIMRQRRDDGTFPAFNEGNARGHLAHASDRTFWNMLPVAGDPLDERELTHLTVEAREKLVAYLGLWREEVPGFDLAEIGQTGFALGVRESRRVTGVKTLDRESVLGAARHADAIGHGVWMVDIHDPDGTGYTTYTDRNDATMLRAGTSYHIPLGMCLNDTVANLGVVGRCASSTHEAHASVRVQTHCMVMGQGVGTAAAMAADGNVDLRDVNVTALQERLRADGVYLEDVPAGS